MPIYYLNVSRIWASSFSQIGALCMMYDECGMYNVQIVNMVEYIVEAHGPTPLNTVIRKRNEINFIFFCVRFLFICVYGNEWN